MIYVLDTNIIVAGLNGYAGVAARINSLVPGAAVLCAPVLAELRFGASSSARRQQNLERLEGAAAKMLLHPFDADAARRFGDLKATFRRRGITFTSRRPPRRLPAGLCQTRFSSRAAPDLRYLVSSSRIKAPMIDGLQASAAGLNTEPCLARVTKWGRSRTGSR